MAKYELLLPKMGESVAEATIIKWVKQPGDDVEIDDTILEIATDKVDSEVPSPINGKLVEQLFKQDEVAQVGDVIAIFEIEDNIQDGKSQEEAKLEPIEEKKEEVTQEPESETNSERENIPFVPEQSLEDKEHTEQDFSTSDRFYSPLVKSIAHEESISVSELDAIEGSGSEGRVTKDDLLGYIANRGGQAPSEQLASDKKAEHVEENKPSTAQEKSVQTASSSSTPTASVSKPMSDEIIEMDRMRKLIADHMISSTQTSAHVTSFVEADVTNMVKWRDRVKGAFEKREGEKITFTPIFVEAVAKAIKDFPMINISLNGNQIIKKKDINIGMAAALPNGNLIVPVIKNADQFNLVGLTKAVNDLAKRSRVNKLQPDEVKGGTFTLTNIGGFGNIMGTPIINQPQVAILAVGAIKKKPAVLETEYGDVIAIRHMMYLSLSYDHRIVDGALGGSFVKKVADYLEAWDANREI